MIQICSGDEKSISFVARGPSNQILRDAKTIWELSIAIREAIASDCQDLECANRQRRDVPIISPIDIFPQELPARKRIVRDEDAAGKLVGSINNNNAKCKRIYLNIDINVDAFIEYDQHQLLT